MKKKILALSCIFILMLSILCSCTNKTSTPVKKTGFFFDTVITITLYEENASELLTNCFDIAQKYEKLFSKSIDTSDVSRINSNPGNFVEVDRDTIELLEIGKKYGDFSNGSFDISIGKLTDLWNFGTRNTAPAPEEINTLLGFSYKNIEISDSKVKLLTDKEKIDLGGIAKGYVADKIAEYLRSEGVNKGLINLGGNILALDSNEAYNIGIQKPFSDDGEVICALKLKNKSVVTSGNYQRYFTENDKLYHHILDVKNGYPVNNDLNAVTIISNASVDGDALSTIAFSLGLEEGMKFIENLDDTEALFITKDNKIHTTSGIDENMIKYN